MSVDAGVLVGRRSRAEIERLVALYGEVVRHSIALELVLSEEAAVRQSGSSILELENWLDTRFHPIANFREQSLNRRIEGRFIGGVAGCANFRQFGEIGLDEVHMMFLQQWSGMHNCLEWCGYSDRRPGSLMPPARGPRTRYVTCVIKPRWQGIVFGLSPRPGVR